MRAVVQRVSCATVEVDGRVTGKTDGGLLIFLGVGREDVDTMRGSAAAATLAEKVANLRIFPDANGKSNFSLLDSGGTALVISQFTLYADCRQGRRPSFTEAADPGPAEALVDEFRVALERRGVSTTAGRFGAHMTVSLVNDGPYTIILDTGALTRPRGRRSAPRSA
jgi:D-tyrosyl-tRNA(Tyr) deacylase